MSRHAKEAAHLATLGVLFATIVASATRLNATTVSDPLLYHHGTVIAPQTTCQPEPGVHPVAPAVMTMGYPGDALVSLTFDASGDDDVLRAGSMLDWLAENELITTWFLETGWAQAHPEIVRRLAQNGHEIGALVQPGLSSSAQGTNGLCREITQNEQLIAAIVGNTTVTAPRFVRQLYGPFFGPPPTLAAQLGCLTVQWSIDPRDAALGTTKQDILNRIFMSPNLRPGAIILMHAGSAPELAALRSVIDGLRQRGFDIVPLGQLLLGQGSGSG